MDGDWEDVEWEVSSGDETGSLTDYDADMEHDVTADDAAPGDVRASYPDDKESTGYGRQYSEEFTCGVCYELMVEPTTLQCGHSFCRHCLAEWFLTHNKQECPSCRQAFLGLPKVSYALRSTMERLMGERYEERKRSALTPHARERIRAFEGRFSASRLGQQVMQGARVLNAVGNNRPAPNWRDKDVWIGLAIITVAVVIVWTFLGWLLGSSSSEPMTTKPMARWTEEDTRRWLADVGAWAEAALRQNFTDMHIDGSLLMAMTEEDLDVICGDVDALHKRALLVARDAALQHGSKLPADFWEYKELHLFKVAWAVVAFQNYPRLAIFFLWLFDYEGGFLPMLHSTCPVMDMSLIHLYTHRFESPTFGQWLDFAFRWLMLPQLSIFGDFAWKNLWQTNVWICLWILISCLLLSVLEFLKLVTFLMQIKPIQRNIVKGYWTSIFNSSVFYLTGYILWNFIPGIVINLWFYFNFIFSTIGGVSLLRENIALIRILNRQRNVIR